MYKGSTLKPGRQAEFTLIHSDIHSYNGSLSDKGSHACQTAG